MRGFNPSSYDIVATVATTRCQHGSQISFVIFIWGLLNNLATTEKNKHRFGILRILEIFGACLT